MPAKKTVRNGKRSVPAAALEARAARNEIARNETPEQKFKRLATERVDATLSKMRQIKNTAAYPHTQSQAARVISALKTGIAEIEHSFYPPLALGKKGGFRMDDEDNSRT